LVTNNAEIASKILTIKNFGRKTGGVEVYDSFGVNFKFTDIQAVVGLAQMKKLPHRVRRMRDMFDMYYRGLASCRNVLIGPAPTAEWIPWFIEVETKYRDNLAVFLQKHSIQTRITYPALHSLSVYGESGEFPNSDHISKNGLFLPTHFLLTDQDISRICDLISIYDLYCA
jgi:perosamine synthetase